MSIRSWSGPTSILLSRTLGPRRATASRDQLQWALERQAEQGLASQVEEIVSSGDKVMVVIRTPGIDRVRVRQAEDRNYLVLTLDQERIIRMRACRNRDEARSFAGIT